MAGSYIHPWSVERETKKQIASGVTHTALTLKANKLKESVHICTIDPQDPYTELHVASAQGGVTRLETVRRLVDEHIAQGKQIVAAINGDFFSALGVPSGLQIAAGEIICSPPTNKVAMAMLADGSISLFHNITMDARIRASESQIAIDAVNRHRGLGHNEHLFLYTNRFGSTTNTPSDGLEVVLKLADSEAKLRPGQILTATVLEILEHGNARIPQWGLVLSATGHKAAWLQEHVKPGATLELEVCYDQGVNQALQVLSGNSTLAFPLIKDGQLCPEVTSNDNPFYSDRHPRTMLATKAGKLHAIIVDGRQPGFSDGLTLAESAYLLQTLGMEQAINIDGGGSTTYLVRPLGEQALTLANRPSDGFERPVGNGLLITNNAAPGPLASLLLEPEGEALVLRGSTLTFKVLGVDANLNPVAIHGEDLVWSLTGQVGTVDQSGELQVQGPEEKGTLSVRHGAIEAALDLTLADSIDALFLDFPSTILEPSSTVCFQPRALNSEGREILISPCALTWSLEGELGAINSKGELAVCSETGSGTVIARYGSLEVRKDLQIGQEPLVLVDFESSKGLALRSKNVVPDSVSFSQTSRPHPIRFGAFSGRVTYDFTGQTGHSSVSLDLLNEKGEVGRAIPGQPRKFGIWVYGDGQGHWLRLVTTDGAENRRNFDFTPLGGLDWIGWRYVTLDVPPNTVYPLTVLSLVLIEPNEANKNAGTIYFDNFRAEYVNVHEDVDGPILEDFSPALGSVLTTDLTRICLKIRDDDSGVNPNSIQMWLNQELVMPQFDPEQGLLSYHLAAPLGAGEYRIQIQATDNAGNPTLPVDWVFQLVSDESSRKRGFNGQEAI